MKCSQSKPFTMTSTNAKMGGAAVRSYEKGGIVEGPNPNIDDDTRERAQRYVDDSGDSRMPASSSRAASPAPKVVTKEELAKSGMSLRDYMNKQQGLTRRGAPAADTPNAYGKEQQYQRAQEAAQSPEAKARRRAQEQSQALEGSYPLENIVGGAATAGIKTIAKLAQNLANRGGAKAAVKRLERPDPTYNFREKELEIIKEVPRELSGRAKQLALPSPARKK
jgi:hypothetical protein